MPFQIADQIGLNNRTHVHGGYHIASRGPVNDVVLAKLPPVLQNDGAVVSQNYFFYFVLLLSAQS